MKSTGSVTDSLVSYKEFTEMVATGLVPRIFYNLKLHHDAEIGRYKDVLFDQLHSRMGLVAKAVRTLKRWEREEKALARRVTNGNVSRLG